MKTVRIAAGAGYAGDRVEPALDIIKRGNADYIVFECLAERTIALAQKEKLENPSAGYNHLLDYRMKQVVPLLREHPIKIVTNMGAANPKAAAARISEIASEHGMGHLRIAAVEGDDVLYMLPNFPDLVIMETSEPLSCIMERVVSANAYMGALGITQALEQGADIVVTGRAADPSLVTGPLMYEYGRQFDDNDFLGKTIVAGHLLECGGQLTGGYYADPGKKDVPELWNLGFPILTFHEDGSLLIEKLPDTGGLLNTHTVKEQLLYELQNPSCYLTPDVIADFSNLRVEQVNDKVLVTGATGRQRTGALKVSIGYTYGWIGTGEISYGGQNCVARAKLAEDIIRKRLELYPFKLYETRYDLLGINSLYNGAVIAQDGYSEATYSEVRLRAVGRAETKAQADIVGLEVESLYTNGPAGGGGARSSLSKVVSVASILIPEDSVSPMISWFGGTQCETV